MEETGIPTKATIEATLETFLHRRHVDSPPIEIFPSPEEGVQLIRAFHGIKQPEMRAALISLATRLAWEEERWQRNPQICAL
jgi:hypothetical protein